MSLRARVSPLLVVSMLLASGLLPHRTRPSTTDRFRTTSREVFPSASRARRCVEPGNRSGSEPSSCRSCHDTVIKHASSGHVRPALVARFAHETTHRSWLRRPQATVR